MVDRFKPRFPTLVALYEHATQKHAERPLFGTKKHGVWLWQTYGEFARVTSTARGGLASLGVGAGDRVAMIAQNRPEWAAAAYATYGRRAAFVPMYESQLPKEWAYILADCAAKVVVVANATICDAVLGAKSSLPSLEHVVVLDGEPSPGAISWRELLERGEKSPAPLERPEPQEIAGYIYTSGTTGQPKGVLLTHANFACNVSAIHEVFPMSLEDRSLSFLPWAHSFGQTCELHGLFSMGASMGLAESVEKIVPNLAEVRPTLLFSVPRIFNRLYDVITKQATEGPTWKRRLVGAALRNEAHRKKLAADKRTSGFSEFKHTIFDRAVFARVRDRLGGRLRYAFSGGAAISLEVAELIDSVGITVYEGYGLTETSPIATANWPGARRLGSVGKAIPGVRIEIDRSATGDPKNGEIIVHGHNVMKGYHRLPDEDAKVFTPDGGFRTGDMGHLDANGFLYITGRIKEQYKLENGKYVVPSPLEEQLKLSPFITNVMVYGDNRPFNVALVVPDLGSLSAWAEEHGVTATGPTLLEDERVLALMRAEIDKCSGEFKQFEKIKKVKLTLEDFTAENGMLTPKMSLKRRVVMERWGAELEKLYA